jgi:hypothetical protein
MTISVLVNRLDLTLLIVLDKDQVHWYSVCNAQSLFVVIHESHHVTLRVTVYGYFIAASWVMAPVTVISCKLCTG